MQLYCGHGRPVHRCRLLNEFISEDSLLAICSAKAIRLYS